MRCRSGAGTVVVVLVGGAVVGCGARHALPPRHSHFVPPPRRASRAAPGVRAVCGKGSWGDSSELRCRRPTTSQRRASQGMSLGPGLRSTIARTDVRIQSPGSLRERAGTTYLDVMHLQPEIFAIQDEVVGVVGAIGPPGDPAAQWDACQRASERGNNGLDSAVAVY